MRHVRLASGTNSMSKQTVSGWQPGVLVAMLAALFLPTMAMSQETTGYSLDEITITARRIEESLQDTPISVTAVTGEMLDEKGIEQITGVANIAPNVNFSYAGTTSGSDSAAVIFIRGVGQNDFTLVTDPGVGLYVDGVYYSRTIGSVLDVFDLERIEVLRGPQGTLFGRNSTGGAISLTTRNPGEEFAGKVRLTGGEDGRLEAFASLDVPVNDEFGFVVSALSRTRDGVATDASGREYGDDDMFGGRIKAVWVPRDDFSLTLAADYVSENEGSAAEVPLIRAADGSVDGSTTVDFTPVTAAQGPSINDQDAFGLSLSADWRLNDTFSVKSITGYRDLDALFARTPASATNFSTIDPYTHKQFSQELQLVGTTALTDFVVGLFYMSEEGTNVTLVNVGVAPTGWPRSIGTDTVENDNFAVYGEFTWNLTEQVRLITGVRYTDENKEVSFVSESIPGVTRGTVSSDPVLNYLGFSGPQPLDFSETTYRVIGQFDLSERTMLYASASTGFKSGGFQPRLVGGVAGQFTEPDTFEPETIDSYEFGVKTDFDNVRINAAVFFSDYDDLHVSGAPAGQIATQTFNGGKASIDGVELEVSWIPVSSVLIDLSLGLLDARYDEIAGANTEITTADELIRTPAYTFGFGASYLKPLNNGGSVRSRIDVTSKAEMHFEPNNSIASFEDGYTAVNVNVAYTSPSEKWTFRVGVNNLTDEKYLIAGDANAALVYDLGIFARSRNAYLSIQADF